MEYIINSANEEQMTPTFLNNIIEQINESINPEGDYNILDNNFSFSKKDIALLKIIDKNNKENNKEEKEEKEENEFNNLINYEKEIFNLSEKREKLNGNNNKVTISSKINVLQKENLGEKRKKCGRKKISNKKFNEHNKFADDNIRRKCKHLVLKSALDFINEKIVIMYGGKIGNGIFKKELKTINKNQKSDATIDFNQSFLNKKLGEIFSESISSRFTNFPLFHNKRLIASLLNEKDENKKKYFTKLFNITFLDCLKHFRGDAYIKELGGLICFENIQEKIKNNYSEDGIDYVESLKFYLDNFENIINTKKSRKQKKKIEQ